MRQNILSSAGDGGFSCLRLGPCLVSPPPRTMQAGSRGDKPEGFMYTGVTSGIGDRGAPQGAKVPNSLLIAQEQPGSRKPWGCQRRAVLWRPNVWKVGLRSDRRNRKPGQPLEQESCGGLSPRYLTGRGLSPGDLRGRGLSPGHLKRRSLSPGDLKGKSTSLLSPPIIGLTTDSPGT